MDRINQRQKLITDFTGLSAFLKLLGQVNIINRRIRENMALAGNSAKTADSVFHELILDTETFYTVAADALKLVGFFLSQVELVRFRSEKTYKAICSTRSELVRHAYDKPDGDSSSRFSYSSEGGISLKAGRAFPKINVSYSDEFSAFWQLLNAYSILNNGEKSNEVPLLTQEFIQRLLGTKAVP